jgi:bacillithiol biosynthesis deacetylase BshB1
LCSNGEFLSHIDCLAFGPHPDDIELFCSGVLLKLKEQGFATAVVDLSGGELSSNGDVNTRLAESEQAKKILNLDIRLNLGLPDGSLVSSWENRREIIKTIRSFKPKICLIPYWQDRHPDHETSSLLLKRSLFDAGLRMIDTGQESFRPKTTLFYMLHNYFDPTFVVDISEQMDQKLESIKAYGSQFSSDTNESTPTYINKPDFLQSVITRAEFLGQKIGVKFAEGFYYREMIKIDNIINFFS